LLLSALYVGWLVQAVALQHLFDYVHVAPLLLALTVVCRRCASLAAGPRRTLLVSLLLLGVAVRLPALTAQRLTTWRRCLSEGSSAELSDRLSLLPRGNCADLDRVRAFLQARQVRDGELTCYNMRTLPLYLDLGVRPSTRYLFLENVLEIFRGQRDRVRADLAAGGQRYFVCDVTVTRWQEQPPGRDPALPVAEGDVVRFPHEKLIYRAGRYAVFAVDGADLPAWMDAHIRP
jgi:hypothetical protein